jgi:16S rRNA (uracil1498-N3)-methyltransferase
LRLTRVYVEAPLAPGLVLSLPTETAAHVAKVLRARAGDTLTLFNGDGREFSAEIDSVHSSRVAVTVGPGAQVDRESALNLTLLQCVPRGDRMDMILQKATELGVTRVVPLLCQRSVVRLDERQGETKSLHWRGVAISACEQCGRNRLPTIESPARLLDYLGRPSPDPDPLRVVLDPDAPHGEPAAVGVAGVELAIGPEGGFAPDEMEALRISGFLPLRFGPRILRTETAAIAAVTYLQARFGDLQSGAGCRDASGA